MTLGRGLRWGPRGLRFLVSEEPLYSELVAIVEGGGLGHQAFDVKG